MTFQVPHNLVPEAAIVALATVGSEIIAPNASWIERLGTVGGLVVVLAVAVRYLVTELAKKDAQIQADRQKASEQIQAIGAAATKTAEDNMRMLLAEVRSGYEVKMQIANSQMQMTTAINNLTATLQERGRHQS